jgi:hypothetical protein
MGQSSYSLEISYGITDVIINIPNAILNRICIYAHNFIAGHLIRHDDLIDKTR